MFVIVRENAVPRGMESKPIVMVMLQYNNRNLFIIILEYNKEVAIKVNYFPHDMVGVWRGRVHIVFSEDPVGVGISVSVGVGEVSFLHSMSLMNGWIMVKLTQIHHWVRKNAD